MNKVRILTPRQESRRQRILAVTRDMVADYGYEGMVMSQVADRAEVSPTTLYNLYNTKDELLLEALRDLMVSNYQKVGEMSESGPGWKYLVRVMEFGASLRAAGWIEDGEAGGGSWDRPSRRRQAELFPQMRKVRYSKKLN